MKLHWYFTILSTRSFRCLSSRSSRL